MKPAVESSGRDGATFARCYCRHFRIPDEDFVKHLFWRSLRWYTVPFIPFLAVIKDGYFEPDLHVIERVGHAREKELFQDILVGYYADETKTRDFFRWKLHMRCSIQRIKRAWNEVMPDQPASDED